MNLLLEIRNEEDQLKKEQKEYTKYNQLMRSTIESLITSNEQLLHGLKLRFQKLTKLSNKEGKINSQISEKMKYVNQKRNQATEISIIEKSAVNDSIDKLRKELSVMVKDLKTVKNKNNDTFQQISDLQDKKEKLLKNQNDLKTEIENLKSKNDEIIKYSSQLEQLQSNIDTNTDLRNQMLEIQKSYYHEETKNQSNSNLNFEPSRLFEILNIGLSPYLSMSLNTTQITTTVTSKVPSAPKSETVTSFVSEDEDSDILAAIASNKLRAMAKLREDHQAHKHNEKETFSSDINFNTSSLLNSEINNITSKDRSINDLKNNESSNKDDSFPAESFNISDTELHSISFPDSDNNIKDSDGDINIEKTENMINELKNSIEKIKNGYQKRMKNISKPNSPNKYKVENTNNIVSNTSESTKTNHSNDTKETISKIKHTITKNLLSSNTSLSNSNLPKLQQNHITINQKHQSNETKTPISIKTPTKSNKSSHDSQINSQLGSLGNSKINSQKQSQINSPRMHNPSASISKSGSIKGAINLDQPKGKPINGSNSSLLQNPKEMKVTQPLQKKNNLASSQNLQMSDIVIKQPSSKKYSKTLVLHDNFHLEKMSDQKSKTFDSRTTNKSISQTNDNHPEDETNSTKTEFIQRDTQNNQKAENDKFEVSDNDNLALNQHQTQTSSTNHLTSKQINETSESVNPTSQAQNKDSSTSISSSDNQDQDQLKINNNDYSQKQLLEDKDQSSTIENIKKDDEIPNSHLDNPPSGNQSPSEMEKQNLDITPKGTKLVITDQKETEKEDSKVDETNPSKSSIVQNTKEETPTPQKTTKRRKSRRKKKEQENQPQQSHEVTQSRSAISNQSDDETDLIEYRDKCEQTDSISARTSSSSVIKNILSDPKFKQIHLQRIDLQQQMMQLKQETYDLRSRLDDEMYDFEEIIQRLKFKKVLQLFIPGKLFGKTPGTRPLMADYGIQTDEILDVDLMKEKITKYSSYVTQTDLYDDQIESLKKVLENSAFEKKVQKIHNDQVTAKLNGLLQKLKIADPFAYYKHLNIYPEDLVGPVLIAKKKKREKKLADTENSILNLKKQEEEISLKIEDITFVTKMLLKKLAKMSRDPRSDVRALCYHLKADKAAISELLRQRRFVHIETEFKKRKISKLTEISNQDNINTLEEKNQRMYKILTMLKNRFETSRAIKEKRRIVLTSEDEMKLLLVKQRDLLNLIDVIKMKKNGLSSKIGKELRLIYEKNVRVPEPPPSLDLDQFKNTELDSIFYSLSTAKT